MPLAVVTGANRGIGLELVKKLKTDFSVLACCRKASPELRQLEAQVLEEIEVTKEEAKERIVRALEGREIDLLIQNAGIFRKTSLEELNLDGIREQFEVNALAPLRLTKDLLPSMNKNSKVIFITSRMGSIEDNSSGGSYGYRMSKSALNMAARSLSHDLRDQKISVATIHPGFVRTDMTDGAGNLEAGEAAEAILQVIKGLGLSTSGRFWHSNGEELPW
ncbi:MAG: SDR family oxidoreductase [Bradymonadales bacterium]|nr:MAG: SDR family oxidoreductase [Bradymonadales bacterium]